MKNKTKGFTLIELLAVIVILALIALIATPIVLNLIKKARLGAVQDSAYGLRKVAQLYYSEAVITDPNFSGITFTCNGTECKSADNKVLGIDGTVPSDGTITITAHGDITYTGIKYNGGHFICGEKGNENGTLPVTGNISCKEATGNEEGTEEDNTLASGATVVPKTGSETYEAVVYLDPTNLKNECDASSYASNLASYSSTNLASDGTKSPTELKTGCMKWYAYAKRTNGSKTEYDLILDHNTTALVAWVNQTDYIAAGGTEADWNNGKFNTKGPLTINKELNKLVSESGWEVQPRMITADEVAHIVGADRSDTINWKSTNAFGTDITNNESSWFYFYGGTTGYPTSYSQGWQESYAYIEPSSYSWLYDYIGNCTGGSTEFGCQIADNNTYNIVNSTSTDTFYGYWTSTKSNYDNGTSGAGVSEVWVVYATSSLETKSPAEMTETGLRPVITITK